MVVLNHAGSHQFKFLVDGNWMVSPDYRIVDDHVGTSGNNEVDIPMPASPMDAQDYDAELCEAAIQALGDDRDYDQLQEFQEVTMPQAHSTVHELIYKLIHCRRTSLTTSKFPPAPERALDWRGNQPPASSRRISSDIS